MTPAQDVGGDFYDVFHLPDSRVGVVMADVSGKGVPAALFMMVSRTLVKGHAVSALGPGEVLTRINNLLVEDNESAMFVTLLYGVLDAEGKFTYANAGHCAPYLVRPGGEPREMPLTAGIALGVAPDFAYGEDTVALQSGDSVFLYTDGVPEAERDDKVLFENERLEKALSEVADGDAGGDEPGGRGEGPRVHRRRTPVRRHHLPDPPVHGVVRRCVSESGSRPRASRRFSARALPAPPPGSPRGGFPGSPRKRSCSGSPPRSAGRRRRSASA